VEVKVMVVKTRDERAASALESLLTRLPEQPAELDHAAAVDPDIGDDPLHLDAFQEHRRSRGCWTA
jgi:hypothetical protein